MNKIEFAKLAAASFYPQTVSPQRNRAAAPLVAVLDTLNTADRVLFPDEDALVEACAGALLQLLPDGTGARGIAVPAAKACAQSIVKAIPNAVSDPSQAIGKQRELLISQWAAIDVAMLRATVQEIAGIAGMQDSFIRAQISNGKLIANKFGEGEKAPYEIVGAEALRWLGEPGRGRRSKAD